MTIPYTALTIEKEAHLKLPIYSGIYPSGEAHFADPAQLPGADSFINYDLNSVLSPTGLLFKQSLSNAAVSRFSAITDFSIFNNYIHESTGALISFNTSLYLTQLTQDFNIYSTSFRKMQ